MCHQRLNAVCQIVRALCEDLVMMLTFVDDAPLCPVFDDECKGPHSFIKLSVGSHQVRVLQGNFVVHVEITVDMKIWIPYFYNWDGFGVYAFDIFHPVLNG